MAESMINRIALLYKKAKSSAWGRTFKSVSERNFYIAEYLVKNDVVEVVRCKDCRCFVPIILNGKVQERGYCTLGCNWVNRKETDFCNYAERKEVTNNG